MNRIILGLVAILSLGFAGMTTAEVDTSANAATGKIVVYRNESRGSISFNVFANSTQLGRIKQGRAISADLPAGTYTIASNLEGSENLTVTIKAGQTVYVDSQLVGKRSGNYQSVFNAVSESVAVTSLPAISDII
ncbi:MAG: hypothetical protein V7696_08130 [Halioglobus sp.]